MQKQLNSIHISTNSGEGTCGSETCINLIENIANRQTTGYVMPKRENQFTDKEKTNFLTAIEQLEILSWKPKYTRLVLDGSTTTITLTVSDSSSKTKICSNAHPEK